MFYQGDDVVGGALARLRRPARARPPGTGAGGSRRAGALSRPGGGVRRAASSRAPGRSGQTGARPQHDPVGPAATRRREAATGRPGAPRRPGRRRRRSGRWRRCPVAAGPTAASEPRGRRTGSVSTMRSWSDHARRARRPAAQGEAVEGPGGQRRRAASPTASGDHPGRSSVRRRPARARRRYPTTTTHPGQRRRAEQEPGRHPQGPAALGAVGGAVHEGVDVCRARPRPRRPATPPASAADNRPDEASPPTGRRPPPAQPRRAPAPAGR